MQGQLHVYGEAHVEDGLCPHNKVRFAVRHCPWSLLERLVSLSSGLGLKFKPSKFMQILR